MSQKWPLADIKQVKNTSQFCKDFIKNCNQDSDEAYFHEVDDQYLEKLLEPHNDLPFLPERVKIEEVVKIIVNLHDHVLI